MKIMVVQNVTSCRLVPSTYLHGFTFRTIITLKASVILSASLLQIEVEIFNISNEITYVAGLDTRSSIFVDITNYYERPSTVYWNTIIRWQC
jgi:hypothetical protein